MKVLPLFIPLLLATGTVQAADITVTTSDDSGVGSLLQAIEDAEAGDCIDFASGLSGSTITLGGLPIVIDKSVTIDASALAEGVTIDADQRSRVFEITSAASGGGVVLDSLTITGGLTADGSDEEGGLERGGHGGGILNQGVLTLRRCTVSDNVTGNAVGDGSGGSGGGIFNQDTLTVIDSTFSGNTTGSGSGNGVGGFGGGIYNQKTLTVTQSTFSGNRTGDGGLAGGLGAAIYNRFSGTAMALESSTIVNNVAGGLPGSVGGGVFEAGRSSTMHNCIIANNEAFRGPDLVCNTVIVATGVNILSDLDRSRLSAGPTVIVGDPQLGTLGDYGGPTQTAPPLFGSLALDAASTTDPGGTDQRELPRFVNGALDIGAVEYQGGEDLERFGDLDPDGDGNVILVEQALGTDPFVSDPAASGNLATPIFDSSGHATLTFGLGADADPATIWILKRSTDLATFTEIFRFDGTTETRGADIDAVNNVTSMSVIDENPPSPSAFYRFEAELDLP